MKKRRDLLAVLTIILMLVITIPGLLSINFSHSYNFVNQYGKTVSMYGYGIYAHDSYFKAPVSIGTDISILFVLVPLFIYTYINYRNKRGDLYELKLISVYGAAFYYAASISLGVTYNRLFLAYVALFSCTLFGMMSHIRSLSWKRSVKLTKGIKIFLVLSGLSLLVAWLPDIIPSMINGGTIPLIEVYTTEITYVLEMGIISPLCFVCLYLLVKRNSTGTMILLCILKLCIIVGIIMIAQTVCQILSGADIALAVLITKTLSFVLLGGFAWYFNQRLYKELEIDK